MTFHGRLNVWMQFQMNKFSKVNIFSHVSEKLLKFSKLNIFRHVYQQFLIFLDISQHLMTSAKYQQKMLKWLIRGETLQKPGRIHLPNQRNQFPAKVLPACLFCFVYTPTTLAGNIPQSILKTSLEFFDILSSHYKIIIVETAYR